MTKYRNIDNLALIRALEKSSIKMTGNKVFASKKDSDDHKAIEAEILRRIENGQKA